MELIPFLICAGTPAEAKQAAERLGLPKGQWEYVLNPHDSLAYHGALYTVVGTFWGRTDALQILDNLEKRECVAMPTDYPAEETNP